MRISLFSRRRKENRKVESRNEVEELERELERERAELVRIYTKPLSSTVALILRSRNVRILDEYPLYEPWSKAFIVEDVNTAKITYLIDEIPLSPEEHKILDEILDMLYWHMKPPPPGVDAYSYFMEQAKLLVHKFRLRLGRTPGISWGKILYYIERETVGYGPIDSLMRDPNIEDISCDGVGKPVYVWHRKYEYIPTNIVFVREEDLDSFIVKLAHKAGKHISVAFPILDAILPGGHRVAATYRKEVSTGGSTFTIRKFREDPITIVDMVGWNTVSAELAAYLWLVVEHKMTGLILGITGAGKTSTLNALATLLRPTVKVVTIEDTPELKLPLENWVQLVSRPSYGLGPEKIGEITLFDLVKVALRYRPDVIIVGEVRGEEAYVLFQAMATGHGGITTMHAEHIDAAIKRLTSPPMNIPPSYIPLANFALVIRKVMLETPEGTKRIVRRITNLWEIVDYGNYVEISKWNPVTDSHEFKPEKSKLLKEYAEAKGWDFEDVLSELKRRETVLRWLTVEGMRKYTQVARIVHAYYARPEQVYRQAIDGLKRRGMKVASEVI